MRMNYLNINSKDSTVIECGKENNVFLFDVPISILRILF